MSKTIILLLVLSFLFFIFKMITKERMSLLSYLLMISFSARPIFTLFTVGSKEYLIGQFGGNVTINILLLITIIIAIVNQKYNRNTIHQFSPFIVLIIICIFSSLNPYNVLKVAIFPPLLFFFQIFLFIYVLRVYYSDSELFSSLYGAISVWMVLEFVLTLLYPILNIQVVSTIFNGEGAEMWSMRREGYPSAVGTFTHPGGLAFSVSLYIIFYVVSYLSNYRKNESIIFILMGTFVVFFTYARTAYVALFFTLILLLVIKRSVIKGWGASIIYYGIAGLTLFYVLSLFPVIHDLFFKSDASEMIEGRMLHYMLGLELFYEYPIMGTGVNNHVYHLYNDYSLTTIVGREIGFTLTNPIHNVHFIILVEMGLIGFACWIIGQLYGITHIYKKITNGTRVIRMTPVISIALIVFSFIYGFFGWSFFNYQVLTPFSVLLGTTWSNNFLYVKKTCHLTKK